MNETPVPAGGDPASLSAEFNHLFVTLERDTVDAIRHSEKVAEYFSVHSATVEADDESWTGVFILGRSAYLEIFPPGGAEGLLEGYSGTAFSTRTLGELGKFEKRLQEAAPERGQRKLRVRKTPEGEVPWFHYLNFESSDAKPFAAWLIDIHPDYLQWRRIELPRDRRFSREAYLKASGVADLTLADDISEIDIELTAEEQADLDVFLKALGFRSRESANQLTYESSEFRLNASTQRDPNYRIRRVLCTATGHDLEPDSHGFGPDARLTARGALLEWQFGPEFGRND